MSDIFALLAKNAEMLKQRLYAVFAPPPNIKTSDWAQQNLYLSKEEGPEPGLYSCKDVPWQAEVMDALDGIEVDTLVIMAASQVGKTTIQKAITGKRIDIDPCPILNVQATELMAKEYSNTRLAPMLRDCPVFKNKLIRDDTYVKGFVGGYVAMAWSQSPATLASRSIALANGDEIDRWPVSSGNEGDPLEIMKARTANYPNAKHVFASSPTTKDGRIFVEFEHTDQRHFHVRCPDCEHEHEMNFIEQLRMVDNNPDTAMLACPSCGSLYGDAALPRMVKAGRFIAKHLERKRKRGYTISRLMTPNWTKLGKLAEQYNKAKDKPELLQVFINTQLGWVYEDKQGQISTAAALAARRENYDHNRLPASVLFLTAGVDTQDDRLEIEVLGHGLNEDTWGVQYLVIYGDPSAPTVWQELDRILLGGYATADGRNLRIAATCVDSGGHHVQRVYEFCNKRNKRNVWAVKGRYGPSPIWPVRISRSKKYQGFHLRMIGVDTIKDTLSARLRTAEGQAGYCHFPYTYDELEDEKLVYFNQLTAERRVVEWDKKGRQIHTWKCDKHKRNEALDCRAYAWAAYVGLVQEKRLNVEQLAQMQQFALFEGDPLTSGQNQTNEVEPAPAPGQNKPAAPPRAKPPSQGRRRVSQSSYVRR
ncbi:hypothetical protein DTO96_102410 [Ephemeroptericola cinctiostellae]|uniref:Phage terminase large subunit (GpA) n=1 Tax=Ephemeroptericola cinctiostellae TaxID=2268024 RepID=A0A345DE67_9BURK|nr:terminase gpA endonuclease subunit [Ephemeroptericola cinctiostellae]AXF86655.1 hypothetical protein DTO96_102410 [Ephemeroptericola cinctiostellae]